MAQKPGSVPALDDQATTEESQRVCGIVMPIAGFGAYESNHWINVKDILSRAIRAAGLEPKPVWEGGNADVIHDRIVYNIFELDVVIVDVSGLNPNVMFELGMRLTLGKPTILISDDATGLPFDTRLIEHIIYEINLSYHNVEKFIDALSARLDELLKSWDAKEYKPFIQRFGTFEIPKISREEVSADSAILHRLSRIENLISGGINTVYLKNDLMYLSEVGKNFDVSKNPSYMTGAISKSNHAEVIRRIRSISGVESARVIEFGGDKRIEVIFSPMLSSKDLDSIKSSIRDATRSI